MVQLAAPKTKALLEGKKIARARGGLGEGHSLDPWLESVCVYCGKDLFIIKCVRKSSRFVARAWRSGVFL